MENDGFKLVKKGKKNFRNKSHQRTNQLNSGPVEIDDLEEFSRRFQEVTAEIKSSEYFRDLKETFETLFGEEKFHRLICLGVGNFSDSIQAKFQLGLFVCLLKDVLHIDETATVTIFEPNLTQTEIDFARDYLGYSQTSSAPGDNLEGRYPATSKTLVFMPHCSKQLTNNLLEENWQLERLQNLVIFSNSFDQLCLSQPERILKEQGAGLIIKANRVCSEVPVNNCFRLSNIFNDLNIHHFQPLSLTTKEDESFWHLESRTNLNSEDLEFVPRTHQ